MRTTVRLDPDVAAAAEALRKERHIGLGEAINELARAGLSRRATTAPFHQRTARLGVKIDITNTAATLETLDEHDSDTHTTP